MLADETLTAFVFTAAPATARAFYEGVLELTFLGDMGHALLFESGASRVMVVKSDGRVTPPRGTALGWHVADLRATVRALMARGVTFERFEMKQDELGIWSPVAGEGVAWFKDPDGSLLSVSGSLKGW